MSNVVCICALLTHSSERRRLFTSALTPDVTWHVLLCALKLCTKYLTFYVRLLSTTIKNKKHQTRILDQKIHRQQLFFLPLFLLWPDCAFLFVRLFTLTPTLHILQIVFVRENKSSVYLVYNITEAHLHPQPGERVYANQLAWSARSLAPNRQGILAYKSCYLYPSQVLLLPVPFINAGVGFPR